MGELLELAKPLSPDIVPYEDRIIGMTPFAVQIRYDAEFEITPEKAGEAVNTAAEIHSVISSMVEAKGSEADQDSDS